MDKEKIMAKLEKVLDPEHPISILDLKIVEPEDVTIDEENNSITIEFKPTTPFCPMGGVIGVLVKKAISDIAESNEKIIVRCKEGAHTQEEMVNKMVNDEQTYEEILNKLNEIGMLQRCILE